MTAAYWACVLAETNREKVALRFLDMAGYETYCPWFGSKRRVTPLFPGYLFCLITAESGWWRARWSIAVRGLVRGAGDAPARVPDLVVSGLRRQERNGLIVLPKKPGLQRGDQVRITRGPLVDRLAIFDGMKGSERVAVLLVMLGSLQRVELSRRDIERVPTG